MFTNETRLLLTSQLFGLKNHGSIIKWTQHIGFLTLVGIAPVVEGNHGKDSKEG